MPSTPAPPLAARRSPPLDPGAGRSGAALPWLPVPDESAQPSPAQPAPPTASPGAGSAPPCFADGLPRCRLIHTAPPQLSSPAPPAPPRASLDAACAAGDRSTPRCAGELVLHSRPCRRNSPPDLGY